MYSLLWIKKRPTSSHTLRTVRFVRVGQHWLTVYQSGQKPFKFGGLLSLYVSDLHYYPLSASQLPVGVVTG